MSMDQLPCEILLMIFRHIRDYRERTRLEQVCRRWRQILLKDGWKNIRRIARLHEARWIEPIGERCGAHLVEFCLAEVNIDSASIRLITEHFPALKHLEFRSCKLNLDANTSEPFRELGTRLRSLTFYDTNYHYQLNDHIWRHFPDILCMDFRYPHLRHLGLHLSHRHKSLPSRFSSNLRFHLPELSFQSQRGGENRCTHFFNTMFSPHLELEKILTRLQKDCPRLAALYMDPADGYYREAQELLSRISELKNLRFLHIDLDYLSEDPELLRSSLTNLPQLLALQLHLQNITIRQLSYVFRQSPIFHGLVHLKLSLVRHDSYRIEPIGLLSMVAPQLRSLNLDIHQAHGIVCEVLKIAQNGILEYLDVPGTLFTVEQLDQLIRLCPNLRSIGAQLGQNEQPFEVVKLRRVVADQWHAGTRKHVPLRLWIYDRHGISWRRRGDPFLTIRTVKIDFMPPNPVLEELFRNEVFNDDSDGGAGTPSFVTKHYSSRD